MERQKLIKEWESVLSRDPLDAPWDLIDETLTLLEEQEAKIEQLNRFVNGFSRDAIPVVRCKDCKHRPKEPDLETYESGFDLEFPEGSKCPCRCCGDEWYSWYPEDDWFCADGVAKDINVFDKEGR